MRIRKVALMGSISIFLLAMSATPDEGQGDILGMAVIVTTGGGWNEANISEVKITFAMWDSLSLRPTALLFTENFLDVSDVGQTFVSTAASDPDFATIDSMLTNGFSEFAGRADESPEGRESHWGYIEQITFGLDTTDFEGYQITSVTMRLDALSFTPDLPRPGWTRVEYSVTFTIHGTTVPVESTSWGAIKSLYTD